jgi:hypothetical protein
MKAQMPIFESRTGGVSEISAAQWLADEYGHPWVRKSWPNEETGTCNSHSIALESQEMELVDADTCRHPPRSGK